MIVASIPSPPATWVGFTFGIFTLRAYALCILVGIVAGVIVASRRLTVRGAQPGVVLDFAICVIPLALVGARIWHVLTHLGTYFGPDTNPLGVLAIWDGGTAIFGALLGGLAGAWLASRWTGVRLLAFLDAAAPGLLIAQGVGRIGDWFDTELFGQPTTLPWGLEVPTTNTGFPAGLPSGTLFQPTFLYELIWDLAGAAVILLIERRVRLRWGRAFAVYLIWYGIGRAVIETIRIDPTAIILGLRVNLWAALLAALAGLLLLAWSRRRHPGVELGVSAPGREWVSDTPVVSRYTAADFEDDPSPDRVAEPATSGRTPTG